VCALGEQPHRVRTPLLPVRAIVARRRRSRITFDEAADRGPTWDPDGRTVTFSSDRRSNSDAWSTPGDGTGSATLVFGFDRQIGEASLSPDGTWLVIRSALNPTALGPRDMYAVRTGVD
jgi:Tol biopolymer transport system component